MAGGTGTGARPAAGSRKRGRSAPKSELSGGLEAGPGRDRSSNDRRRFGQRRAARTTEQVVLLSLAIIFGLVGFPVHVLWIVSIVLMVLLWSYLAADLSGSRRNGGMISDVVTTIGDEVGDLTNRTDHGTERVPGPDRSSAPPDGAALAGGDEGGYPEAEYPEAGGEPTKKELYDKARRAGIDGRSTMSKEELQESLDE